MDFGFIAALAGAFAVGALHALEPGHGKTVVAAYLVGNRGKVTDALTLGAVVTITHTSSVFLLAAASVLAAAYFARDQVQYWLGIVSGLLVLAVGLGLFALRLRGQAKPTAAEGRSHPHPHHDRDHHPHADADEQDHHEHPHPHPQEVVRGGTRMQVIEHDGHTHMVPAAEERLGLGALVALGVSGGIVPCPAAMALIPAALTLGGVLRGLSLVVSFSVGLAVVLMAIGVGMVKGMGAASRYMKADNGRLSRRLSLASACFILLLGVGLTARAIWWPEVGVGP